MQGIPYFERLAKAETRGWAEGLAMALEIRIGSVPEALRARIFAADVACIQEWCGRAREATDFESIFDPPTAPSDSVVTSA